MSFPRQCSVSVDIDSLRFYHQIHGLPWNADPQSPDPAYTHAMPRLLDLFASFGIRATLFVIGEDVHIPEHAELLKRAVAEGHELANHTYHHPYRLTRLSPEELEQEIALGEEHIGALLPEGERIRGFRCPGYNITPEVLKILRRRGYTYDSSVFPSAPYYLAKGAVMGWLQLVGRPSKSMLGSPRVLMSPLQPFVPGEDPHIPHKTPNSSELWEMPVGVLPGVGLPYIGTSVVVYPRPVLTACTELMKRTHTHLNLELHAIDMMDPERDPGVERLISVQPDLKVSLREKRERFGDTFFRIAQTHSFATLLDVAQQYQQEGER